MVSPANVSLPFSPDFSSTMAIRAWRTVDAALAAGEAHYDRQRMLAMLLRMWPGETIGEEPAKTKSILARLRLALRRERALARTNPLRYDINRHIALIQAWRAESATLRRLAKA
jgi:hypothetical protein